MTVFPIKSLFVAFFPSLWRSLMFFSLLTCRYLFSLTACRHPLCPRVPVFPSRSCRNPSFPILSRKVFLWWWWWSVKSSFQLFSQRVLNESSLRIRCIDDDGPLCGLLDSYFTVNIAILYPNEAAFEQEQCWRCLTWYLMVAIKKVGIFNRNSLNNQIGKPDFIKSSR